jgi:signal transduction histidine kinase
VREERDDGTRFEHRYDLELDPQAAREHMERLRLEAGHEGDFLFLHGAAAAARPIPIPRAEITGTITRFRSELLAGALGLAAAGLLAAALVAERTARPLRALADAARRVGAGELGVEVAGARAPRGRDEVGAAVASFNRMSRRLSELDGENRRLAESERLSELAEVARGLAHTLRNPLNALGLSVEQLAGGGADPAAATALGEAARRQIRRIDGSLRSFLALASADAAAETPVDLATLAREVALEALQDAGGRVSIEVDAPRAEERRAVAAELKAALQALVVNAVEASPAGGTIAVRVGAGPPGRSVVEVEDAGCGLPEAVAARLFEPHVTTKPHGSGMGLFLAHRIVTGRYGGALGLAARAAGGTLARVELGDRLPAPGKGG